MAMSTCGPQSWFKYLAERTDGDGVAPPFIMRLQGPPGRVAMLNRDVQMTSAPLKEVLLR